MGCCRSKSQNSSKLIKSKVSVNDYFDKESQSKKLYEMLDRIDSEIQLIKEGVTTTYNKQRYHPPLMAKKKEKTAIEGRLTSKSSEFLLLRKRSCYLAQLIIFVRWTIKVRQVNQADHRFDEIISQISSLIDNNDEFLISSLENKIRHILNKK